MNNRAKLLNQTNHYLSGTRPTESWSEYVRFYSKQRTAVMKKGIAYPNTSFSCIKAPLRATQCSKQSAPVPMWSPSTAQLSRMLLL
jgi:hypothetical protein